MTNSAITQFKVELMLLAPLMGVVLVVSPLVAQESSSADVARTGSTSQPSIRLSSPFFIQGQLEEVEKQIDANQGRLREFQQIFSEAKAVQVGLTTLSEKLKSADGIVAQSRKLRIEMKAFPMTTPGLRGPTPPDAANGDALAKTDLVNKVAAGDDRTEGKQVLSKSPGDEPESIRTEATRQTSEFESLVYDLQTQKEIAYEFEILLAGIERRRERILREIDSSAPSMSDDGSGYTTFAVPEEDARSYSSHPQSLPYVGERPVRARDAASLVEEWSQTSANTSNPALLTEVGTKLLRLALTAQQSANELERKVEALQVRTKLVTAKIERQIDETEARVDTGRKEQDRLGIALQNAYAELTRKSRINPYLVTAIVMMIVAMVLLYFSLAWFRTEFAAKIIRQRVLIELLSMSFLLLTVIILGTGRLLDSAALAALLGTITGYIFGRKAKRSPATDQQSNVPIPSGDSSQ